MKTQTQGSSAMPFPSVAPDLYRQLADAMPQLVWIADRDGNEEYYNSRLSAYVDPTARRGGETIWHQLIHPDDWISTDECWQRALLSGEKYECEHRLRLRDGTYRWHLSRAHAAVDAQQNVVKWFGTATDIHSTKRAELNAQFLVELESRLRAVSGLPGAVRDTLQLLRTHLTERLSPTATSSGPETLWVDWRMLVDTSAQHVDIDGRPLSATTIMMLNNGRPLVAGGESETAVDTMPMHALVGEEWSEERAAPVLLIPVLAEARAMCVLYVRAEQPRPWCADEVALIRDVANRLWFVHDRARAIDAARQHEASLRLALDAAQMGSWELDVTTQQFSRSARFDELFGYADAPPVFDVERLMNHVHPQDRERLEQCLAQAISGHKECSAECRVIGADGVERWVAMRGSAVADASGGSRLTGLAQDITARRLGDIDASVLTTLAEMIRTAESEDALRDGATRLIGAHLRASRCFFAETVDDSDNWKVSNDYADPSRLFPLSGTYSLSLHSPLVRTLLRDGRTIVVDDTAEDDRTRQLDQAAYKPLDARALIAVPLLRDGQWLGVMAACADQPRQWTAREQTMLETVGERVWLAQEKLRLKAAVRDREQAVQRSDDRYRSLFESMDQALCVIQVVFDADGMPADYVFLEANPLFERYTGLANVVGQSATELAHALERHWIDFFGTVAKTRRSAWVFEHTLLDETRWFDVYAFPFEDASLHRVAVFFSDVTARRRTEAELRDADRRKDEFLATLAHELRNPLAPLRTGIEVLQLPNVTPNVGERTLHIMDRQLTQLVRLVDDLLDISRISRDRLELRIERVVLQEVIESAVESCRALIDASGHELSVSLPAAPLELEADFTRLAQVCANLLNNAARYTAPKGHIAVFAFVEGPEVVVRVTDNGYGIDSALLTQVFDPFVQGSDLPHRHGGGLGIGLTLVRRIIEMHDGRVSAKSAGPGLGSEFELRLPLHRQI